MWKFDPLLVTSRQIGAERLARPATMPRIRHSDETGRYELLRAVDGAKDQTYFLFGLTQEQMSRTDFPLGELDKRTVREIARRAALPVAEEARKPGNLLRAVGRLRQIHLTPCI